MSKEGAQETPVETDTATPESRKSKIGTRVATGALVLASVVGIGLIGKKVQDDMRTDSLRQEVGTTEYASWRYYQKYTEPDPDGDTQQARCLSTTPWATGEVTNRLGLHLDGPAHPAAWSYDSANDVLTLTPTYEEHSDLKLTGFRSVQNGGQLSPVNLASKLILDQHGCEYAPLVEPN